MPVYTSNEDFTERGAASPADKAALKRIHAEGYAAHMSVGSVHVFLIAPDGHLAATLHVAEAGPAKLLPLLEQVAQKVDAATGPPVYRPVPPHRPSAPPGGMRLHVVTRYVERRGDEDRLIVDAGGNWSALPGEDWVTLTIDERRALVAPGAGWDLPEFVGPKLLRRLYPPTENNDLATGALVLGSVSATRAGDVALLSGQLRLTHPFYKGEGKLAQAQLTGYLRLDRRGDPVALRMLAETGTYGGQPYVAVVRDA